MNEGITSRDKEVIIPLYSEFARPHLESCVLFWSLQCKKDADRLEMAQRWGHKCDQRTRKLLYEEKLRELAFSALRKEGLADTISPCSNI